MTELRYEAQFEQKISRLFIFRPFWIFVEMWVLWVWTLWMGIITFLQFWHMLILGKRHEGLWKRNLRFMRNMSKWQAYLANIIDQRPKFIED